MERVRHIKETAIPNKLDRAETDPDRERIDRTTDYDPETEVSPEQIKVREYLNKIDEDTLKGVFAEHFRKSGNVEETMNWIPVATVRIERSSSDQDSQQITNLGGYSPAQGIALASDSLWLNPELTLWTLIHEECHAVSQKKLSYYNTPTEDMKSGAVLTDQSGVHSRYTTYSDLDDKHGTVEEYGSGLNEGITELLTERILTEYKKRTGTETYVKSPSSVDEKVSGTDVVVANRMFNRYGRSWQNIRLHIGILSSIANVPEDVVENSVIRSYLRNGSVNFTPDSEEDQILNSVYPGLGLTLYRILHSKKDTGLRLTDYVDEITSQDIPDELKQRILAALQKVKNEWGEAYKISPNSV